MGTKARIVTVASTVSGYGIPNLLFIEVEGLNKQWGAKTVFVSIMRVS